MRTLFDVELDKITADIRVLGQRASEASVRALNALLTGDYAEARQVKRSDRSTDELRYEIENACLVLIATQQPVARDLRRLVASTFVAVELERCGDYAKGIAKAARRISRANTAIKPYNLVEMEALARRMLERVVGAFLSVNSPVARQVIQDDRRVDQMYDELLTSVTAGMKTNDLPIESGTWLLHAGHSLERYADRATNIAERVIFVDTGQLFVDGKPQNGASIK
jgi:phosphate transport system protein